MKRVSFVLSLILEFFPPLLASWLIFVVEKPEVFFHSDMLYLPSIYRDLFVDGFSITGWSFTPAPYFFPDMPLYFLLEGFTGNTALSLGLYGLVQVSLFVLALRILVATVLPFRVRTVIGLWVGILILLSYYVKPLVIPLLPSAHFSSFLVSLFLFAGLIRLEKKGTPPGIFFIVLVSLMVLSDRIFLLHYGAPAIVYGVFLFFEGKKEYAKRYLANLSGGLLLGLLFYFAVKSFLHIDKPGRISPVFSIPIFFRDMQLLVVSSPVFTILILGWVVALAVLLVRAVRKNDRSRSMALFSFLLLTALAPPVVGFYTDLYSTRYNIYVLYGSTLLLSILLYVRFENRKREWIFILFTGLLYSGILIGVWRHPVQRNFSSYTPELVSCLDSKIPEGVSRLGLADYWNAKRITLFSHTALRAYHVDYQTLMPSYTLANRNWFACHADHGCPDFSFVIATHLDREKLRGKYGEPDATFFCGDDTVYLYLENGHLRQFLRLKE